MMNWNINKTNGNDLFDIIYKVNYYFYIKILIKYVFKTKQNIKIKIYKKI